MRAGPIVAGVLVLHVGACCLWARPARAEEAERREADVEQRLAWLERVLDREATATRVWKGGWVGIFGGAAALEAVLAGVSSQPNVRVDSAVNAGKAVIAFAFTLILPAHAGPVADRARAMPRATLSDGEAKLRYAEAQLALIAEEERERRGFLPLVGGALLNAAGAAASFAGHKGNGGLGWIGASTGLLIAQIQFHTQPTGAIRAWERYRRGEPLGEPPPLLRFSIGATTRGGSLGVTF